MFTIQGMAVDNRRSSIERFIIQRVDEGAGDLAHKVAKNFGLSRQGASRYIRRMVAERQLIKKGETRSREYFLPVLAELDENLPVSPEWPEDKVWRTEVAPIINGVAANVADICHHGVSEMVNNVIDHSGSTDFLISVRRTAAKIDINIFDRGVGIFRKIKEAFNLEDDRHAIFELTKGKITTDPDRHTGEGIFFTSRMFDTFSILSGGLFLWHRREGHDWLIQAGDYQPGTTVTMKIGVNSTHTSKEVFDKYTRVGAEDIDSEGIDVGDYAFARTRIVVDLMRFEGESLVSRSQAKRLVARLDKFREIILDFRDVESIGPAFADEIFRVYQREHPEIKLIYLNANEAVAAMIRRSYS